MCDARLEVVGYQTSMAGRCCTAVCIVKRVYFKMVVGVLFSALLLLEKGWQQVLTRVFRQNRV